MSEWHFNLRTIRLNRGLTIKALAEKAGCARNTIERCEKHQVSMNFCTMTRVLDALGVTPNDLISKVPINLPRLDRLCYEHGIKKDKLISDEEFYERYGKSNG